MPLPRPLCTLTRPMGAPGAGCAGSILAPSPHVQRGGREGEVGVPAQEHQEDGVLGGTGVRA